MTLASKLSQFRASLGAAMWTEARKEALRYSDYDAQTLARRPFINVGAGNFVHRYWTNLDYHSDWYARKQTEGFVHYDLTSCTPLPFEDGSIEIVYTSHTIEHVSEVAVENLLREAYRVLRPGGGLRITCPDAALLHRAAARGCLGYFTFRRRWFLGPLSTAPRLEDVTVWDYLAREIATRRCRFYRHAEDPVSPETMQSWDCELGYVGFLNRLGKGLDFDPNLPGDHVSWWDESKLVACLRNVGFSDVYRSAAGQSLFPPMTNPTHFDTTQPYLSLWIEAIR